MGTLGNPVPENDEHSRHLIDASVESRIIGRLQDTKIPGKKDVIVEFSRRAQCNR